MTMNGRSVNRPFRPHLWLIKFIGVLVPRRLRADWRQEWEAELRHREALLAEWERLDWRNYARILRVLLTPSDVIRERIIIDMTIPARTSSVSLTGVSHGPRSIIALEGVDSSSQVIAFGQSCPLDYQGPNTEAPLYFAPTSFFAPTAGMPACTSPTSGDR